MKAIGETVVQRERADGGAARHRDGEPSEAGGPVLAILTLVFSGSP